MGRTSSQRRSPQGRARRPAAGPPRGADRLAAVAVSAVLFLAVAAIYGQTAWHEFVNYDDQDYVSDNRLVAGGLSIEGVGWAFRSGHAANWHPLTWLSHMADCSIWSVKRPGGHHLTNVLLHAATAVLLFLVLREMTGDLWPSAATAALFAVHPLHVESVAWVAERKDVLSGLFFVLTLGAYVGYARRGFSPARYLLVLVLFALGLMAKPMLVTLPFVLLLLDYWPLGRFAPGRGLSPFPANVGRVSQPVQKNPTGWETRPTKNPACGGKGGGNGDCPLFAPWQLLLEKLPLVLLSAASCAVTYQVQSVARLALAHSTFASRLANALVSYVAYLKQFFYPAGLAPFYPYPEEVAPAWKLAGAAVLLAGVSAAALVWRKRHPYLLVGWLWYLGMLVPVIGLVQVGQQAMADRYTYLPQIGVYVALAWGLAGLVRAPSARRGGAAVGVAAILVFGVLAWRQASKWRDNETLWTHTLACTSGNSQAHYNLGLALAARGRADAAREHYQEAVKIAPNFALAHHNLALLLAEHGEVEAAMAHYRRAFAIKPDLAMAHNNLGRLLAERGEGDEAIAQYRKALEIDPDFPSAHNNLGLALEDRGALDAAMTHYRKALEIEPDHWPAHYNLGRLLAARGRHAAAAAEYEKALAINPRAAEVHNNLAILLARRGETEQALQHYEQALALMPDYAEAHYNLGNLLAQRGQYDAAIARYRQALAIRPGYKEARENLAVVQAARARAPQTPRAAP